ncbi:MAG: DAK2 domain-containing protein, partial [Bacilli bacterium]|nr:DAK2 domain-containing protein [Bacilli bacterium]
MNILTGNMFRAMLGSGYAALKRNVKEVNRLNVFPIPDGDTGTNMGSTMEGGIKEIANLESKHVGRIASCFANGALYAAKGNSGVILSQFFAGLSDGLSGLKEADVQQFSFAMDYGVRRAYQVVQKPVEGTILTVMREGASFAKEELKKSNTFEDYFTALIQQMKVSLENTPELLQVLKDAGVIDSGGAGLLYIIEGMAQAVGGKIIEDVSFDF